MTGRGKHWSSGTDLAKASRLVDGVVCHNGSQQRDVQERPSPSAGGHRSEESMRSCLDSHRHPPPEQNLLVLARDTRPCVVPKREHACGSVAGMLVPRIYSLVVLATLLLMQPAHSQEANIKTVLGGSIRWHLENDFEVSRNVTFTLVTFWDKNEIAYEGTGIEIVVGEPIQMPTGGLTFASRFGNLKVMMGNDTYLFPNKFTVMSLENDLIEGWCAVTLKVPDGAYFGNASLTGPSGGPLQRAGIYAAPGVVDAVDPNGGLQRCEMAGPSPIPCEVFAEHTGDVLGPNPIDLGFFATISLPQPGEISKLYRGKVRNRNSPYIAMRPLIWITDQWPGKSNSFMLPAFDRDGDRAVSFVGGSKQASSGSAHMSCEKGNMTSFGCFGPGNDMDGPPYDSINFVFDLQEKVATASEFFFYSFTMNVTDGYGAYALTELLINYCNPVITVGQSSFMDRAAEFIDLDAAVLSISLYAAINYPHMSALLSSLREKQDPRVIQAQVQQIYTVWGPFFPQGNIIRRRPSTFFECTLEGPCFVTIYAARFDDNVVTTPSRHPNQQGDLEIYVSGSALAGHLGNQTTLANGMVFRNFTFGKLPDGSFKFSDIGSHRIVCLSVQGHTPCKTPPLCITMKVRGHKPRFLAPTPPMKVDTDDVMFDVVTPTPVCAGFSVSFGIKAFDPDENELVTLDIYDNTGDGYNIFSHPYNAQKIGNFTGTTEVAFAEILYTLDYAEGVQRDPVTRAVSFARDRQVCTVLVDNTLAHHYAFGDVNAKDFARSNYDALYRGNFVSRPKCHEIAFSGPPAFLTSPSRFDGSPFASFDGDIEERLRVIDAFIGQEKSITFRAKDPNYDGRVTIFILEDPGIPNGAVIGPNICEPQKLIVSWNASGLFSECAVASRTITWTPHTTVHYQRNYRICAVARDSTPIKECPNPKMTSEGWYGEEHCTEIQVIPPQLRWTNNSQLGPMLNYSRNVFVPCATSFVLEAEEIGSGFNNTGVRVLTPYEPVIMFVGDKPDRASMALVTQGRISRSILSYTASRGDEGRVETFCFTARDDQSVLQLPTSCLTVTVKRCVYCVNPGDTLERIMQELAMDLNWLRLWAANGNEDGDVDTTTVYHPDDLMKSSSQHIINIGSIYTVEDGDNLAALAVKFQTTVRQILSVNPDVSAASVEVGQPLCIIPCGVLPRLPGEDLISTQ